MNPLLSLWHRNRGFVLFLGMMLVFRSAVADWNYVPSSSMNPTLLSGDRVLVDKLAYSLRVPFTLKQIVKLSDPRRGDIITFDSPADEINLIKRVVAIAGDQVQMRENQLHINGVAVPRALVQESLDLPTESGPLQAQIWGEQLGALRYEVARLPQRNRLTDFSPVTVPAGHVMVLGDSRDNSADSRFIGFIPVQRITGQALRVVLSHDSEDHYLPRSGRWWLPLSI